MATALVSLPPSQSSLPSPLQAPPQKRVVRSKPAPKIALGDITVNNVGTLRKLNSVLFPVSYSDKFYKNVLDPKVADFCKFVFYNDLPVGAICCRVEHPTSSQPTTNGSSSTSHTNTNSSSSAPSSLPTPRLYIMTLGVLAPYRRLGLASLLLEHVLSTASKTHLPPPTTKGEVPVKFEESKSLGADAAAAGKKDKKKDKKAKTSTSTTTNTTTTPSTEAKPSPPIEPVPPLASTYVHVQLSNHDARRFYELKGFEVEGEVEGYYRKVEPRGAWVLGRKIEAAAAPVEMAEASK